MTSRVGVGLLAFSILLCAAAPGSAQDAPATGRIPVVTREVKLFLELEDRLAVALRRRDAAVAQALLTDDFELRVASGPGNPTPRAEWLRLAQRSPGPGFAIEQMAVHGYGDVAVVSFLQVRADGAKRDPAKDIATVDVWKRDRDVWQLAVRYAGPAGNPNFVIPGASNEPPIRKKY